MLKLRGNLQAPQLLADLTASGLQWQALRINRVKIDGDVRSTDQIQGQLAVRVEQLKQDALEVSLLTLDAKGSEKQHQLQLKIDGKPVSGQLALQGSFDRQQRWRGNLNNTRFDTPVGEWRLTRAIALDYLNTEQKISVGRTVGRTRTPSCACLRPLKPARAARPAWCSTGSTWR